MRKNRQEGPIRGMSNSELAQEIEGIIRKLMTLVRPRREFNEHRKMSSSFWYMEPDGVRGKYYMTQFINDYGSDLYGENETDYLVWLESEVVKNAHAWDTTEDLILANRNFKVYRSEKLRKQYSLVPDQVNPVGTMIDLFQYWSRILKLMQDYNELIIDVNAKKLKLH